MTHYTSPTNVVSAKMPFGRVNLANQALQPPGTLLASILVPPSNYTYNGATEDAVLWRCDKDDVLQGRVYFLVATNGNHRYFGHNEVNHDMGVPDHVYATQMKYVGIRQTMGNTVLTRKWQRVELLGWDRCGNNPVLACIRLKHIPPLYAELYRIGQSQFTGGKILCAEMITPTHTGTPLLCPEPNSYIQLVGPELPHDEINEDSNDAQKFYSMGNGFGYSMWKNVTFSNIRSCGVRYATPQMMFPTLKVNELERGGSATADFSLELECSEDTISGTGSGETAIGLQVSPQAFQAASTLGFVTSGGGVHYLLSDGYGTDPSVATGVGITLYSRQDGARRWFLGPLQEAAGQDAGWYPILQGAQQVGMDRPEHIRLRLDLMAKLTALPGTQGKPIRPGKVHATAHVLVKVQ